MKKGDFNSWIWVELMANI